MANKITIFNQYLYHYLTLGQLEGFQKDTKQHFCSAHDKYQLQDRNFFIRVR